MGRFEGILFNWAGDVNWTPFTLTVAPVIEELVYKLITVTVRAVQKENKL